MILIISFLYLYVSYILSTSTLFPLSVSSFKVIVVQHFSFQKPFDLSSSTTAVNFD